LTKVKLRQAEPSEPNVQKHKTEAQRLCTTLFPYQLIHQYTTIKIA
jgi:hypothetical protein